MGQTMQIGSLATIWRYPTKSLRCESLEEAEIDRDGVRGDRTSALVATSGHARTGKTYRGKEHDRLHLTGDEETARALAAARGVQTELRRGERFFDDAPISLLLDVWLDGLSRHVGYTVQPIRFRPNLYVRAAPAFSELEGDLTAWDLELGSARLKVRCPIERCVVTTYDPDGGRATRAFCASWRRNARRGWESIATSLCRASFVWAMSCGGYFRMREADRDPGCRRRRIRADLAVGAAGRPNDLCRRPLGRAVSGP